MRQSKLAQILLRVFGHFSEPLKKLQQRVIARRTRTFQLLAKECSDVMEEVQEHIEDDETILNADRVKALMDVQR